MIEGDLARLGWCRFGHDPELKTWVDQVREVALVTSREAEQRARWLRHGGTWYAGVNALPNDANGSVGKSGALSGQALQAASEGVSFGGLDRGQISICYPGYPGRDAGESDAAHRFRLNRDAAHLDGLIGIGTPKRRFFQEYHAFILGIPLTDAGPVAAPFVVWEGSHEIMRQMLIEALDAHDDWTNIDVTEAYVAARRRVFETCQRREIYARPGEATLVHRFALHGVAPWRGGAGQRAIVYFRPHVDDRSGFLSAP